MPKLPSRINCRIILSLFLIIVVIPFIFGAGFEPDNTRLISGGISPLSQQEVRLALIVGNSAYDYMNPLANPSNDAADMQRLLEQVGFEVILILDGSLEEIEGATRAFIDSAKGEEVDVALFFYAGHAVQYEGSNYLIPTDADIKREYELISKAYLMDTLLKGLERSSAELNLIILDACRDNPFSSTRGGERGLSAMGFGSSESMVVFATAPGKVAEDGKGENSPFTEAMKEHLLTPDLEIRQLIAHVSRSVQEETNGRQVPWVNTSFTGEFYFLTSTQELYLRQIELTKLADELLALEAELLLKQYAVDQAQSAEELGRLKIEQLSLEAQATAKRLEEERIKTLQTATEQRLAALEEEATAKIRLQSQLSEEGKALQRLAQQRRSELDKLAQQQSQAHGAMERLQTVAQFEQTIVDVDESYAETIRLTNIEFEKLKDQQVASYLENKPRAPWETEAEYNSRIQEFESPLKRENAQEIAKIEGQRDTEITQLTNQMNAYKQDLTGQEFTIGAGMVNVEVLPFSAEGKYFPIRITNNQVNLQFSTTVHYRITATDFSAISAEYNRIDDADKANALVATMYYSVEEKSPLVWELAVKRIELHSLLENDGHSRGRLRIFIDTDFSLNEAKRVVILADGVASPPLYAAIPIVVSYPKNTPIFADGIRVGFGEVLYKVVTPQSNAIIITAKTTAGASDQQRISFSSGLNQLVTLTAARVGGLGPAGGYVFYDKGFYSDGWRYLEAAPEGWYENSKNDPVGTMYTWAHKPYGTKTDIGSGRANTIAVSKGERGATVVASLVLDYSLCVDGECYADWFVPSSSELLQIHKNLHLKGLGGFSNDYYWSSSESSGFGRYYDFKEGEWEYNLNIFKGSSFKIRPVRVF